MHETAVNAPSRQSCKRPDDHLRCPPGKASGRFSSTSTSAHVPPARVPSKSRPRAPLLSFPPPPIQKVERSDHCGSTPHRSASLHSPVSKTLYQPLRSADPNIPSSTLEVLELKHMSRWLTELVVLRRPSARGGPRAI